MYKREVRRKFNLELEKEIDCRGCKNVEEYLRTQCENPASSYAHPIACSSSPDLRKQKKKKKKTD